MAGRHYLRKKAEDAREVSSMKGETMATMKVKRLPVIVDDKGRAQVCQACLVKWARERVGVKLYCVACAGKAIRKERKREALLRPCAGRSGAR
jgi:hypothetical protein